ncbi:hypothetical protein AC244_16195 [Ensifer adhaerens]|uniref:Uncharacterized protein n=1 Tax=Ensifer adhaerens TaxID=106592 RepID=A0A0L8BTQ3_ENSAD|nr:hypothetical protein [Ensifer adhaerens]KOF17899.1 hypothetical protein AC244_16195 [Ensifer adhaerens]
MPKIAGPKHPKSLSDRELLYQEAIEAEFQSVADRAYQAGWSREEVATALMELADNNFLAMNSNAEMFELGAGVVLLARKPH